LQSVNGALLPTLRAVEEEFSARRLIVEHCKSLPGNWREIRDLVRRQEVRQLDELLYDAPPERFDEPPERRALLRICRRRPSLLLQKSVLKFFLRRYGGTSAVFAVRRLIGHGKPARPA